jgi:hypothetical protein
VFASLLQAVLALSNANDRRVRAENLKEGQANKSRKSRRNINELDVLSRFLLNRVLDTLNLLGRRESALLRTGWLRHPSVPLVAS